MLAEPMLTSRRRSPLHPGLAGLLWLALLLPLAQSAAMWHGYSHLQGSSADERRDGPAPRAEHCDLCLSAAALAGGALLAAAVALGLVAPRDALPHTAISSVWRGLAPLGYRSRAPPIPAY